MSLATCLVVKVHWILCGDTKDNTVLQCTYEEDHRYPHAVKKWIAQRLLISLDIVFLSFSNISVKGGLHACHTKIEVKNASEWGDDGQ